MECFNGLAECLIPGQGVVAVPLETDGATRRFFFHNYSYLKWLYHNSSRGSPGLIPPRRRGGIKPMTKRLWRKNKTLGKKSAGAYVSNDDAPPVWWSCRQSNSGSRAMASSSARDQLEIALSAVAVTGKSQTQANGNHHSLIWGYRLSPNTNGF